MPKVVKVDTVADEDVVDVITDFDAEIDLPAKMIDAAKTVEKDDYSYDETEYEILDDDYSVEDLGGRTDDWKDHHNHE